MSLTVWHDSFEAAHTAAKAKDVTGTSVVLHWVHKAADGRQIKLSAQTRVAAKGTPMIPKAAREKMQRFSGDTQSSGPDILELIARANAASSSSSSAVAAPAASSRAAVSNQSADAAPSRITRSRAARRSTTPLESFALMDDSEEERDDEVERGVFYTFSPIVVGRILQNSGDGGRGVLEVKTDEFQEGMRVVTDGLQRGAPIGELVFARLERGEQDEDAEERPWIASEILGRVGNHAKHWTHVLKQNAANIAVESQAQEWTVTEYQSETTTVRAVGDRKTKAGRAQDWQEDVAKYFEAIADPADAEGAQKYFPVSGWAADAACPPFVAVAFSFYFWKRFGDSLKDGTRDASWSRLPHGRSVPYV
eukprot:g8409.t1